MPTKPEWDAIVAFGLWILVLLPFGLLWGFAPKLWRTWKGKSERPK
jgi:hypothetical protein